MYSKLQTVLFGLGVFAVFTTFAVALRYFTSSIPQNLEYFGIISKSDIVLGLIVALVVTFNHERKKNSKH
ncbi:MAG TPA: hypothetical protein VFC36_01760 [Paludibacter sp.]|jgi:cytochrome c biogenesis protein CcdA|nr:hypothetical protein [Paludibacter sp.]